MTLYTEDFLLQYEEDPEAHRLLFRGHIDRASVCGQILTTKDRNAFRIVFRPGQVDRIYDFDWRSGKDNAWDQLAARTGGYDAWRERDYEVRESGEADATYKADRRSTLKDEQVCRRAYRELYGDDVLDMFRTFTFGVKPGHQGRGIGRAMHEHTVNEAREAGAKFVFFSNLTNVPLYEQLGCKVVKTVIGAGEAERLVGYPEGSEGLAVLEAINGI